MKKTIVLALMAMAIVAIPATAQTRKEKKAAEKAQWEQKQQFAAEEAALRHQMKMDSLANAQKVAEEQRRAAEAQAAADKAAAEAKAKAEAEAKAAQEITFNEPCMEAGSTETYIRARGIAESLQHQSARTKAQSTALRDLASKINISVKSLLKSYIKDEFTDMMTDDTSATGMYVEEKMQNMIKQVVDQNLSYSTFCEETKTYMKNNRKVYKCYMTLQTDKDAVLKPVFDEIHNDQKLQLDMDYNEFKEEFDKEFEKQL